jgi:hypothetical protein
LRHLGPDRELVELVERPHARTKQLWCAPILAATTLCCATPAAAQFRPNAIIVDLTQQASQRSASVTTTIKPACVMNRPTASVSVASLLPAAPVSGVDSDAAQIIFGCNTPTALLSISSTGALTNSAPTPIGRDATKFTTRLPFSARADLLNIGQTSGASVWVMSDSSLLGPRALPVGTGTGQRIRTVAVSAQGINSSGRIPVAGTFTGSICVGVDPAGVVGSPQCGAPTAPVIWVEE